MREKGITLVALVITIIVLLILAGVTINLTIGEDGIIRRAQQAVGNYTNASEREQAELGKFDEELENILKGNNSTPTMIQPEKRAEKTERSNYTDGKDVATIPEGFTVSGIPEEQKIEDGLVIYDIPVGEVSKIDWNADNDSDGIKDVQENYNQFVWIPCGTWDANTQKYSTTEYGNAEYYSRKDNPNSQNWGSSAYESDVADKTDVRYKGKTGWNNPSEQITTAKESISKYGGFYIARYEAGVPEDANFYVASNLSSDGALYKCENNIRDVNTYNPVSKKGNQVWNFISQEKAKEVSENMYKNNNAVNSYLIDSNAWNYICKDILEDKLKLDLTESTEYGNYTNNTKTNYEGITGLFAKHINSINKWTYATQYEYKQIPEGTAPKGNESNSNRLELATGASEDFNKYNIYDMAGNVWEWTTEMTNAEYGTEHQTREYGVRRGGCFYDGGSVYPVVFSLGYYYYTTEYNVNVGFRPVLYVK